MLLARLLPKFAVFAAALPVTQVAAEDSEPSFVPFAFDLECVFETMNEFAFEKTSDAGRLSSGF